MSSSTVLVERPPTVRSATTNDPLRLRGVDGRSTVARRYRDAAIALADDLGGQNRLSESAKLLVRLAASLTVQVEALQSRIVAGGEVDLEQAVRMNNALSRTLSALHRRQTAAPRPDAGTSLQDYVASKAALEAPEVAAEPTEGRLRRSWRRT
jgi:hypothetical protein